MKVMTPEFDYRIADWLEDDPDKAPSIVLETVTGALPAIPQRHTWRSLPRFNQMPRFALVATIVVVATLGIGAWAGSGLLTPQPSPTPMSTAAPTPASTPREMTGTDQVMELAPGRYHVAAPFGVSLEMTMPDGWKLGQLESNVLVVFRPGEPGLLPPGFVTVMRPDKVYPDPCRTETGPSAVGGSVDELVTALTSMAGFTAGPVTDVSIGGASGKSFTLHQAIDHNLCTDDSIKFVTYERFGFDQDVTIPSKDRQQIWVLDVGGERILVQTETFEHTTAVVELEVAQIVQSIDFD